MSRDRRGPIYPGSFWEGVQISGSDCYPIRLSFDTVDFINGTIAGLIKIRGLTPELDTLVTYFEGEIIGTEHGFMSTPEWGSSQQEDLNHWARFPSWKNALHEVTGKEMKYNDLGKPFLFMRLKERCVLPQESEGMDISSASYSGFYYVCVDFNRKDAVIPLEPEDSGLSATEEVPLIISNQKVPEYQANHVPASNADSEDTLIGEEEDKLKSEKADISVETKQTFLREWASNVTGDSGDDDKDEMWGSARITGCYFSQNREPLQQISLHFLSSSAQPLGPRKPLQQKVRETGSKTDSVLSKYLTQESRPRRKRPLGLSSFTLA